jgi:uncharacterized membrane protein
MDQIGPGSERAGRLSWHPDQQILVVRLCFVDVPEAKLRTRRAAFQKNLRGDAMPKKTRSAMWQNSRWIILSIASILATAPLATNSPANAYTFTPIDVPGAVRTVAFGINGAGQIVGTFADNTGNHGFLDTGGSFTQIDVPGATLTEASGINSAGQIVGTFVDNTGTHGFLDTGGSFTQIDVPGASYTDAGGINDAGQIVGFFGDSAGDHGINDAGQIVGWVNDGSHGFLDTGGSFTQIDVPGAVATQAFGINDAGQIVGGFYNIVNDIIGRPGTFGHGFLDTGGSFTQLDVRFTQLDVPGATIDTRAFGINGAGQIVGSSGNHGFLATGSATGDPHFTTYDGVHYDYQGVGDFVLARSTVPGDQFDVQVRTTESFWNGSVPVSFMMEAAATLCNHNVTFDVGRPSAGESFVWIDGSPSSLSIASPVLTLGACKIVELSPEHYQVFWNTGEMLDVTSNFAQQDGMSAYYLDLSSQLSWIDGLGSIEGLLSSDLNPDAWRVTAATSLLDPIPEPDSLTLLAVSLAGLGILRRRSISFAACRKPILRNGFRLEEHRDHAFQLSSKPTRTRLVASSPCAHGRKPRLSAARTIASSVPISAAR